MTDDDDRDQEDLADRYPFPAPDPEGNPTGEGALPDSDPRHLDPAADLVDHITTEFELSLADDEDGEDLREFLRRAEAGEFDADPGLEAAVRIVRDLLEDDDGRE